jgi:hypothetical protein
MKSIAMPVIMITALVVAMPVAASRPSGIAPDWGLSLVVALLPGRVEVTVTEGGRAVPTGRAEGGAVLVVDGRELGIALLPAGGNRLVGLAPYGAGDEVAAEISVTIDGRNVKAHYGLKPAPGVGQ